MSIVICINDSKAYFKATQLVLIKSFKGDKNGYK